MSVEPWPEGLTITVTGGAGGIAASTADIATSARLVGSAASHLADARRRCTVMVMTLAAEQLTSLLDFTGTRDPVRTVDLAHARDAVDLLSRSLLTEETSLRGLDRRTDAAAAALEAGEQAATRTMLDVVHVVNAWDLTPFGFARTALLSGATASGTWRERVVTGFGAATGKLQVLRNPLRPPGLADGATVLRAGGQAFSWLGDPHGRRPPPGDLRPGHLLEHHSLRPPVTSVTAGMAAVEDLDDGEVSIQRIPQADGTQSWVVFVRGTDDLSIGSPSPFSAENNLVLAEGARSTGMDLVESAMQQAGVPVGAVVGLYGHSQGGTVAMRLAADPTFTRRYQVRSVLTAGSPVAGITVDRSVAVLSVENEEEIVSSLAGTAPPDEVTRTTVTADLPGGTDLLDPDAREVSAHSLDTHARVLDEALAQGAPGVREAVDLQGEVLARPEVVDVPRGDPDGGRRAVQPLADVDTWVFSAGAPVGPVAPAPGPAAPAPARVPPDLPALSRPEPPRLPGGELDWAQMTEVARRTG